MNSALWVVALTTASALSVWADGYKNITVEEAIDCLYNDPDAFFLDVREQGEWDTGHIPTATLMPWSSGVLQQQHGTLPAKPLVVHCWSGGRSAATSQFLVDNGHASVCNMLGGYSTWSPIFYQYYGDMEPDGDLDLFDILRIVDIILDLPPEPTVHQLCAADVEKDGDIDLFDLLQAIDLLLEN